MFSYDFVSSSPLVALIRKAVYLIPPDRSRSTCWVKFSRQVAKHLLGLVILITFQFKVIRMTVYQVLHISKQVDYFFFVN